MRPRHLGLSLSLPVVILLAGIWLAHGLKPVQPELSNVSNAAPAGEQLPVDLTAGRDDRPGNPAHDLVYQDWAKRRQGWAGQADAEARQAEMVAFIEKLAATDPELALFLVRDEKDPKLRAALLKAALGVWGRADPEAASDWLLTQTLFDRAEAASALLEGIAQSPEQTRRIAEKLMERDPAHEEEYGTALVRAFEVTGKAAEAARFAGSSTSKFRADWIELGYSSWAGDDPRGAMESAVQIQNDDSRRWAVEAAVSRWSTADAQGLAEFAMGMPEGRDRAFALSEALRRWMRNDLIGTEQWLVEQGPTRDMDEGMMEIATHADIVREDPDRAVSWARAIVDPERRGLALSAVITQWARSDFDAAWTFAETSPDLTPEIRESVLGFLTQTSTHQ